MNRDSYIRKIVFYFLIILTISLSGYHIAFSQDKVVEPLISQGERIEIPDKGFAISAPIGWEVYREYNGSTLYFQAPLDETLLYRRNIRIMSFQGSKFIDEVTFKGFAKEIVEKSSKMSNSISGYRIRNLLPIDIADGRKAGLYYAEFTINEVPMMQMHILVSTQDDHFLLTYTDLTEHFESKESPFLDEAYVAMQSVSLEGSPPSRFSYFYWLGIGIGGLFTLIILFRWLRARRVKRLAAGFDEFESDEEEGTDAKNDLAVDDSYVSDFSTRKKSRSKTLLKKSKKDDDAINDETDDESKSKKAKKSKVKADEDLLEDEGEDWEPKQKPRFSLRKKTKAPKEDDDFSQELGDGAGDSGDDEKWDLSA